MNPFSRSLVITGMLAVALTLLRPVVAQQPDASQTDGLPTSLEERYRQLAEQLKQDLPERKLKPQTNPAAKWQLFRADPKLLEYKFFVELALVPAGLDLQNSNSAEIHRYRLNLDQGMWDSYPIELRQRPRIGNGHVLWPVFNSGELEPVSEHFKRLIAACPADLRPDKTALDFLSSPTGDLLYHFGMPGGGKPESPSTSGYGSTGGYGVRAAQPLLWQFFTTTAEEAQARAEAIVRLYDCGLSRPMQQYLLAEGTKALEKARGQYAEVEKLTAAIDAESKKLDQPSEISDDILRELKAQKVMVAIELAGLSARVKACDTMLADPKRLEISTLQSISDMRIKSEIDRVGIKEKLDQINNFIAEGDGRQASQEAQHKFYRQRNQQREAARASQDLASRYAELFVLYSPLQVLDNQIALTPIEWTSEKPE